MSIPRRTPTDRAAGLALLAALLLAGCSEGRSAPGGEPADAGASTAASTADVAVTIVDDAGREVRLARPARRIVSLLPSGTETLLALGAGERLVGRTRYDRDPRVAHLPSIGGGLDPSIEALLALRPDLVLVFEGATPSALRERLESLGIAVAALAPQDTADVFRNLERLGRLSGREPAADSLGRRLRAELDAVRASVAGRAQPSVLYVVGTEPLRTAGPETFIGQLLGLAGARSIAPTQRGDWPQLSLEEVVRQQPDVILLPQGEDVGTAPARLLGRPGWRELRAVREGRVVVLAADLLHRPGPGIAAAARALRDALHPAAARP